MPLQDAGLLGVKVELALNLHKLLDAGKEGFVEKDFLPMPGEFGRQISLGFLQGLIGVGTCEIEKEPDLSPMRVRSSPDSLAPERTKFS